ncbi:ribonuclease H-like domain-containing protein [Tanacetum coccineum]
MPPKYDLILADEGEYVFSESVTSIPDAATSEAKTSVLKPKSVGEPLIEDWISDSEDENETKFKSKQRKPSFSKTVFVKSNKHVKTPRESVKKIENKKQAKYPRKNSQSPRGNQRNWNNLMTQKLGSNFKFKNKACYECGSFNHLIKDCDLYEKKMVEKTVWNNARRANHQNSQRMTHPHPKGNFVPKAVLMKSGIKSLNTAGQNFSKAAVSVNTARPINTAYTRPTVNSARKASNVLNKAHTHVRRPFNKSTTNKNSNLKEKVNTIKGDVTTAGPKAVVSNNKGNEANVVKASTCWVWRPKQKVLDHVFRHNGASMNFKRFDYVDAQGRSKHMTGNKSYLLDYEEIDGGFVAFGGDPKGGRITGKGKIGTDTVMSDSEDSTVTYTAVSSPFADLPDIGSPGVDGPPVMPEDPYAYVVAAFQAQPSPDYVSGPEYPPSPDFVPEPVYPEFMPPEDEVLPAEEQPLPAALSPTADSPGYVPKSDPEEDPADYPADRGDDGDDEDESSDDDEDDDVDIEGDEEEEEHPAPADSAAVALPAVDHAPSTEETEPFETEESVATPPPHPAYRVTARISIRDEPPTPFWSYTEIPSPPLPPILSPPLHVSSPPPASPIHAPSSGTPPLLPIPLPTSSPPLHLLSTDRRADRPKVTLPSQKRLGIALGPRYEVRESASAPTARPPGGFRADNGFVATMDREIMQDLERDVDYGITDTWDEMLTERQLMASRLNMLYRDRRAHARTARLMEAETRMSREAWGRSIDASDLARAEVISQEIGGDYRDAGSGPQETGTVH